MNDLGLNKLDVPPAAAESGRQRRCRAQDGMGKPESGDSGPAWPSDMKVEEDVIPQRTILGGAVVLQHGRGPPLR